MPLLPSVLFKVLFVVLLNIPFVHAQSPAATQSTTVVTTPSPSPSPTSDSAGESVPAEEAGLAPSPTVSETPEVVTAGVTTFEELFNLGTRFYQEKNYEAAVLHFAKALQLQPDSTAVLTDLGLSYYQLKKPGLAIAYFRRALFLDPSLPAASSALTFAISQLEIKEIPHQIETYESLRSNVLNLFSLGALHLLTALLMFSSGFIWLKYVGRRKRAFEAEEAPPALPVIGILLSLSFVTMFVLMLLKIYDLSMPRATIIADKVSAQIAPGEGQNSLFELYAGFEVLISNSAPGWTQVRYPGGLTGWVKNDSLMPTSGQNAF